MAYPAMLKFLPHGVLGLMIAGMEAAYRSTIMTHLNWGSSYLVHDFYRRFLKPEASERHYVLMGRVCTGMLMLLAALLTFWLDNAKQSFELILSIGAGTGLIYLLRWFWWRINAWCEVAAMASSFIVALGFFIANKRGADIPAHVALLITIAVTTAVWLAAAVLTPQTDRATLLAFYRKVRPAGPGWRSVRAEAGVGASPDSLPQAFLAWMCGIFMVYGALFGTGALLYGRASTAAFWIVVGVAGTAGLLTLWPRLWAQRA
jgi:Na+/proline symporter